MDELQGPIVGEVLVLLSVFIPTAFISGITGQLYKQFALTIAVSTAFSGFNDLTFTPAMCALFLRPTTGQSRFVVYRWFNAGFEAVRRAYNSTVGRLLAKPVIAMLIFVAICGAAFWASFACRRRTFRMRTWDISSLPSNCRRERRLSAPTVLLRDSRPMSAGFLR